MPPLIYRDDGELYLTGAGRWVVGCVFTIGASICLTLIVIL
jgi:hypothetical protein